MFQEILLHPCKIDLHRFLMRDDHGKLKDFRMKRLTFGVKSFSDLATQVLRQLVDTHSYTHPEAAKAIPEDFFPEPKPLRKRT